MGRGTEEMEGVEFYGAVTVSDRGQVAIPAGARRELKIEEGEKLLVFRVAGDALLFTREDNLKRQVDGMLRVYRSAVESRETGEREPK